MTKVVTQKLFKKISLGVLVLGSLYGSYVLGLRQRDIKKDNFHISANTFWVGDEKRVKLEINGILNPVDHKPIESHRGIILKCFKDPLPMCFESQFLKVDDLGSMSSSLYIGDEIEEWSKSRLVIDTGGAPYGTRIVVDLEKKNNLSLRQHNGLEPTTNYELSFYPGYVNYKK